MKINSLTDPTKKMSKSDPNANSYVAIVESRDETIKKIKRAVTDSEAVVRYAPGKDGINNLMGIYSCCTGLSYEQIEKDFDGKGYGDFKSAVAEAVVEELRPFKTEFNRLINDKAYLNECAKNGAEKASRFAQRTLSKAMKKSGLYQL
jgi:tryptophanyl-tRNA synthetase